MDNHCHRMLELNCSQQQIRKGSKDSRKQPNLLSLKSLIRTKGRKKQDNLVQTFIYKNAVSDMS